MNRIRVYGLTCVLTMAAAAVQATTIVMPTDEQLIAKSPVIVTGTVVSSTSVDRGNAIWTDTRVEVASALKGSISGTITIHEIGGEVDGRFTKIFGAPRMTAGERVLLFLEPAPQGGFRTMDLYVGKLGEAKMLNGRRLWIRDDATAPVVLLDANFKPIEAKNVQRDGVLFETFVRDTIAGRTAIRNYGVENPVLEKPATGGLHEDFNLLSEPRIDRWGSFDSGGSATWYSSGTQPGYSGGGVTELQSGMAPWNNYSSAKIRYTYAGNRAGTPGGLQSRNGFNEVIFNDALNEISGSYNPSTGGVVGQGGYTGLTNGGPWAAPFTADGVHTAATYNSFNIIEGNLTIQDGVSPSSSISSNRLAEIIAHEFGHTLGFGHSSDGTALMFPSVTGLGPSLRADDQLAARWLYPNGTVTPGPGPTPTVPAAPSALNASATGTTVSLTWNDNASDETGQSIYYAAATGSFTKAGDVGANVRGASLTGFTAGTWRFYVVAFNGAGTSAASNTATATVAQQLTADFSFTPQTGTAGVTTFTFTDISSGGTVTGRSWNFGDGTSASTSSATHLFARAGTFSVTLTVTNGSATAQTSKSVIVNTPLVSAFTYSPASPTTNDTISFADQSAGGVTAWSWSFGDGTSAQAQNPAKRYTVAGNYTVTLTVNRLGESSTSFKSISVAAPAPLLPPVVASFDASATSVITGTAVNFIDRSTGSPTSWLWTFGDGTSSNVPNPVHVWSAAGTYTVSLFASNGITSSTSARTVVVTSILAYRSLVSAAAQQGGLGGTSWRTELSLFNAGTQGANVNVIFIPGAGGTSVTRALFLSPNQSITYANTLFDLFNISNGAGALAIEATSAAANAQLRVTSRTFTSGTVGTYGQAVPDVQQDGLQQTLYITGIQSSNGYRTNIGLVNRSNSDVGATLTLYDGNGVTVSSTEVVVPANNFQQAPLSVFFAEVAGRSYDALSMRLVAAAPNAVTAYASVIDNTSQDPVYIQAAPAPAGSELMIPVVGRSNGENGTFWRSDVTIFNPTGGRSFYSLRYNGATKSLFLDSRATTTLADVVTQMGFGSGSSGAVTITWSGPGPIVTSRTYTSVENGGTFGQSIDPVASFRNEMYVTGLRADTSFRSNIGFLNGGSEQETFIVALLAPAGYEIARTVAGLDPGEVGQYSVTSFFPNVSGSLGNFTLVIRGDNNAKLFAFASMIDNASGDPVFFAGR